MLIFAGLWAIGAAQTRLPDSAQIKWLTFESVKPLIQELANPNVDAQRAALRFWTAHGDEVDERLGEIDEDDPQLVRFSSVRQDIVEHISHCIDSSDPTIHRLAIKALCSLGENGKELDGPTFVCGTYTGLRFEELTAAAFDRRRSSVESDLIRLTADPDPTVAWHAFLDLDPDGQSRVSDRLRRDLSSPNKLFKGLALNCLHLADAKQAVSLIGPLLGDSDNRIQEFARVTLMEAGVTFMDLWPHRAELPRRAQSFFLRFATDEELQRHLREVFALLNDSDPDVRAGALLRLRASGFVSEQLAERYFYDPGPQVQAQALYCLFAIKSPRLKEYTREALLSPNEEARFAGLSIADKGPDRSLMPEVLKAIEGGVHDAQYFGVFLQDSNPEPYLNACISSKSANLRALAAEAMLFEPQFASKVLGMQNEADPKVLKWVVMGLGENNEPAATQALERIALRSSGEVLEDALTALAQSAAPVKDFLLPYLSRKGHPLSYWARFWICHKCGLSLAQTAS